MSEHPESSAAAAGPLAQALTQWPSAHAAFGRRHQDNARRAARGRHGALAHRDSLGAVHDRAEMVAARRRAR